jgi:hypothetical protein
MTNIKEEIEVQIEHSDNLFDELNKKTEILKKKLLDLSETINSIIVKIETLSPENI